MIQQLLRFDLAIHCHFFLSHILHFIYCESLQPSWCSKLVIDSDFLSSLQGLVPSCGLQKQCFQSRRMYQNKIKMNLLNKCTNSAILGAAVLISYFAKKYCKITLYRFFLQPLEGIVCLYDKCMIAGLCWFSLLV